VTGNFAYRFAKALEGIGLIVILVGLLISLDQGLGGAGLEAMRAETLGLGLGILLFVCGYVVERTLGTRS
tara:strand:- start:29933 stop:30142 length:210 start_codon:yes stop_codon:yes gene_type:complete